MKSEVVGSKYKRIALKIFALRKDAPVVEGLLVCFEFQKAQAAAEGFPVEGADEVSGGVEHGQDGRAVAFVEEVDGVCEWFVGREGGCGGCGDVADFGLGASVDRQGGDLREADCPGQGALFVDGEEEVALTCAHGGEGVFERGVFVDGRGS